MSSSSAKVRKGVKFTYVKVKRGNIAYFIRDDVYAHYVVTASLSVNDMQLLAYSDFAVDVQRNLIVKARDSLEHIIDNWTTAH